ncbi:unknown [Clostridium sp. CAG:465]|nr:unknown [Clostridium sp. CAG:465]
MKYFDFIIEIGNQIIKSLNNSLLFSTKFEMMQVTIEYSDDEKTNGKLISMPDMEYEMKLTVNPNDKEEYIKFIIGHELFHFLFRNINKVMISDYCSSDDSFAETNVRRIKDGKEYGIFLEEKLCDFLSLEILSKLYKEKYTKYDLIKMVYNGKYEVKDLSIYQMLSQIIETFGKLPSDKLDEYTEKEVSNLLLYTAITGSMSLLINDFEECMGKESWKRFNDNFDLFCITAKLQYSKFIFAELQRFKFIG